MAASLAWRRDISCSEGYLNLQGERIFIRVLEGYIVLAEAPTLAGSPNYNRKWRAGYGRVPSVMRLAVGRD